MLQIPNYGRYWAYGGLGIDKTRGDEALWSSGNVVSRLLYKTHQPWYALDPQRRQLLLDEAR